jgi:cytochrome c-type biogenesis protein CcmH
MRKTLYLLTALLLLGISGVPALAQTPTPNEINAVAKDLWCPLCSGVRLDNCELQACIQMREVIAQKLVAGESKEQIKAYFVQQYGDVVLGEPARQGFNLIVWIFPILAVVVGLGWLAYLVTTWQKRKTPSPSPAPAGSGPSEDDYLKRVEQELKQDN